MLLLSSNGGIESVLGDDLLSNLSSSEYSNIYPFTQLSPPGNNNSLSHQTSIYMECDTTSKNLNQNGVSNVSALVSDLSTSNESKIQNKSSSSSSILSQDLNKCIHYRKSYETI